MRACIHRGSKQIGGNCVEIESQGARLVIDLGLPLDALEDHRQYLPHIIGLQGDDPILLGLLISHPHVDHFGLLAHISPNLPVGMGGAARRILTAASPFLPGGWPISSYGWEYSSEQTFEVGPFRITPYLMDHSAYDSYVLLIESDGKRLLYSGDLRAHGRKAALFERLVTNPPRDIDTLLLEGSSLGRLGEFQQFPKELDVEERLVKVFSETDGLALVHTSAQNIDRVVTLFRACKRTGRKLVIDLYSAAILEATGNPNIPQSYWPEVTLYVPQWQRRLIKKNAWFDLLKYHSHNRIFMESLREAPNKSALLFRPLHCQDLDRGECLAGAVYIYSQWAGYWERGDYQVVKEWLVKHDIEKFDIHTSGHASIPDLQRFVKAIHPCKVIPIHSFFPQRYADLFANVEIHHDGEWWEV